MKKVQKYINMIKDGIFPVFCFSCKKEGKWLCFDCENGLLLNEKILVFSKGDDASVKEVFSALSYKDPFIHDFLYSYKYFFAEEAEQKIKEIVQKVLQGKHKEFFDNFDLIVPIPLHKKRYLKRGFNQAETIAKYIARYSGVPMTFVLERGKDTLQQAKLNKEKRKKNLENAFEVTLDVVGQRILLVDDVFTRKKTSRFCTR